MELVGRLEIDAPAPHATSAPSLQTLRDELAEELGMVVRVWEKTQGRPELQANVVAVAQAYFAVEGPLPWSWCADALTLKALATAWSEGCLLAQERGRHLEVAKLKHATAAVEVLHPTSASTVMPFGPAKRAADGTFQSIDHGDDPWTMFPVSMRASLKRRCAAHSASKGMKGAKWARIVLEAAIDSDQLAGT